MKFWNSGKSVGWIMVGVALVVLAVLVAMVWNENRSLQLARTYVPPQARLARANVEIEKLRQKLNDSPVTIGKALAMVTLGQDEFRAAAELHEANKANGVYLDKLREGIWLMNQGTQLINEQYGIAFKVIPPGEPDSDPSRPQTRL